MAGTGATIKNDPFIVIPHMVDVLLHRRAPTIWFVNSMSNLFHENLEWVQIEQVFARDARVSKAHRPGLDEARTTRSNLPQGGHSAVTGHLPNCGWASPAKTKRPRPSASRCY